MSWVYLQLPPKTESLWSPGWLFWRQLDLLTPCPPHWSVSSSLNNEAQLFHLRLLLMSVAVSFIMLSATLPKACLPPELFVARLPCVCDWSLWQNKEFTITCKLGLGKFPRAFSKVRNSKSSCSAPLTPLTVSSWCQKSKDSVHSRARAVVPNRLGQGGEGKR